MATLKYRPIQARVTIPSHDPLVPTILVDREDFNDDHFNLIMDFWKKLKKQDSSFNVDKAMLSTFVPDGFKEEETEAHDVGKEAVADLEGMTVSALREYADVQGIDLGTAKLKAEIVDAIKTAKGV